MLEVKSWMEDIVSVGSIKIVFARIQFQRIL